MKIACLGDVHANLPALEAVLAHADEQGAEAIWNVGDFVGYNAFPDEVVRLLQQRGAVSILGNYDRKTLKAEKKKEKWQKTKRPEKRLAFLWAYEHLSPESRTYLESLPKKQRLTVLDRSVLLVHGSPADPDEYLTPDTPAERLRELAEQAKADLVICGHSHLPFVRSVSGVTFINTGSVGRPDDGDPRACYAFLTLEPGKMDIVHYRVDYDIDRAVAAIRENGLPEEFAEMIIQGKDLNGVNQT